MFIITIFVVKSGSFFDGVLWSFVLMLKRSLVVLSDPLMGLIHMLWYCLTSQSYIFVVVFDLFIIHTCGSV